MTELNDESNEPQPEDGDVDMELARESSLGRQFVGLFGLLTITLYLVLFAICDFYFLIKVWPPTSPTPNSVQSRSAAPASGIAPEPSARAPTAGGSAGQTQAADVASSTSQEYWKVNFAWCDNAKPESTCWISINTSLFLISVLSGALGSLLHALRSLYWYAGNRHLVRSWSVMYVLLPFTGAVLSVIFYVVIRGGFLPQSTVPSSTAYSFAALGTLVGLFSQQASLKLKQVAETVFTKSEQGRDTVAAAPKLVSISPTLGPASGGTVVSIIGTNFAPGVRVNFGGVPAATVTRISQTSVRTTTPAHSVGPADVEVLNPDNQKDTMSGGFIYT